ncbi:MAG TPA: polysaccharide deacetylase family protein [Solirubrobacteraceae bacterium]|nr:polysaccharide deacetylase family protein [Solirubrobacteraceae bacterium]
MRQTIDRTRSLLPQSARERLYEWHPGRARRWREHPGIQRVPTGNVVLTFDDGPDEDATASVLDALQECDARATFFLLGSQATAHPDLALEIARRGHEIGLHGYGHQRHDRIDAASSRDDLARGSAALEDVLGVRCRWYRPPYGKMSAGADDACRELGLTTVYWSAWGLDWEDVDAGRIASVTLSQIDDGGVVLLHDSALYARRTSAQPTADAIPLIAAGVQARGLSLVSLGEAIGAVDEVAA